MSDISNFQFNRLNPSGLSGAVNFFHAVNANDFWYVDLDERYAVKMVMIASRFDCKYIQESVECILDHFYVS